MHFCHVVILDNEVVERHEIPNVVDIAMKPHEGTKWDWWRIGGRYDGVLTSMPSISSDNGFNFSPIHEGLDRNVCRLKEIKLPWKGGPYSFIDLDEQWYEKPNEHDFIEVNGKYELVPRKAYKKELAAFEKKWETMIKKNPDAWAVMVDYHN